MKSFGIWVIVFLISLSGCGNSSPSASDIEEAGKSKGYKISVEDYKCEAQGERTYSCRIHFTNDGYKSEWEKTWLIRNTDDGWVIISGGIL